MLRDQHKRGYLQIYSKSDLETFAIKFSEILRQISNVYPK